MLSFRYERLIQDSLVHSIDRPRKLAEKEVVGHSDSMYKRM
jgi:hypothetical protein